MNHKHKTVVSSYSDLSKISSHIEIVHFRKFISKKLLKIVLEKCPNLVGISISKYASKRLNLEILKLISNEKIRLEIYPEKGRPNNLKQRLYKYSNIVIL